MLKGKEKIEDWMQVIVVLYSIKVLFTCVRRIT